MSAASTYTFLSPVADPGAVEVVALEVAGQSPLLVEAGGGVVEVTFGAPVEKQLVATLRAALAALSPGASSGPTLLQQARKTPVQFRQVPAVLRKGVWTAVQAFHLRGSAIAGERLVGAEAELSSVLLSEPHFPVEARLAFKPSRIVAPGVGTEEAVGATTPAPAPAPAPPDEPWRNLGAAAAATDAPFEIELPPGAAPVRPGTAELQARLPAGARLETGAVVVTSLSTYTSE